MLGRRFLRLKHVGRRTGRRHTTVLEVVRHDPRHSEFVVVSGFGSHADWLRNILVRRVLSWLLGWHYDGSVAARRQLVEQLPLVTLRPCASTGVT